MYCEHCGTQLSDTARFCLNCGQPLSPEKRKTAISTYEGPLGNPTPVLVWGILGLAFALSFYFSYLGVVFSFITIHKNKVFRDFTSGAESTQATIGRRLGIAGVIVGFVFTILLTLFIVCLVVTLRQPHRIYYPPLYSF